MNDGTSVEVIYQTLERLRVRCMAYFPHHDPATFSACCEIRGKALPVLVVEFNAGCGIAAWGSGHTIDEAEASFASRARVKA